jgi:hypothetical protein
MTIQRLNKVTIVTVEPSKYLVLKNTENSEQLIGKPKRIIFDNSGIIPELEEREV